MSSVGLWLGVGALGGAGALARFLLDGAISARVSGRFPTGTLVVNVSGAVLLGVLVGIVLDRDGFLLAGTAVLGSYTTFSTWMFETHRLAEQAQFTPAALNVVLSLCAGVAGAELGRLIGAW